MMASQASGGYAQSGLGAKWPWRLMDMHPAPELRIFGLSEEAQTDKISTHPNLTKKNTNNKNIMKNIHDQTCLDILRWRKHESWDAGCRWNMMEWWNFDQVWSRISSRYQLRISDLCLLYSRPRWQRGTHSPCLWQGRVRSRCISMLEKHV